MECDLCETTAYCLVSVGGAAAGAAAAPCLDLKRRRLASSARAGWSYGAENVLANRPQLAPGPKHNDMQPHTSRLPVPCHYQRTVTTVTTNISPMGSCRKRPNEYLESSQYGVHDLDQATYALQWHSPLPAAASSVVTGYSGAECSGTGRSSCSSQYSPVTSGCVPVQDWHGQQQQHLQQLLVQHGEQHSSTSWARSLPCLPQGPAERPVTRSTRPNALDRLHHQQFMQPQELQQLQRDEASHAGFTTVPPGALSHAVITTPFAGASASIGSVVQRQRAPLLCQPGGPVGGAQLGRPLPGLDIHGRALPTTRSMAHGAGLREAGSEWWAADCNVPHGGVGSLGPQQLQFQVAFGYPAAVVGACEARAAATPQPWQHAYNADQPASHSALPPRELVLPAMLQPPSDPLQQQPSEAGGRYGEQGELTPPETPPAQCEVTPRMQRWASAEDPSTADTGRRGCTHPGPLQPQLADPEGHAAVCSSTLPGQPGSAAGLATCSPTAPCAPGPESPGAAGEFKGQRVLHLLLRLSPLAPHPESGDFHSSVPSGGCGAVVDGWCCSVGGGNGGPVQAGAQGSAHGAAAGSHCAPDVPVSMHHRPVMMHAQELAQAQADPSLLPCGNGQSPQRSEPQPAGAAITDSPYHPAPEPWSGSDAAPAAGETALRPVAAESAAAGASGFTRGGRPATGSPRKRRAVRGLLSRGTASEAVLACLERRLGALMAASAAAAEMAAAAAAAPFPLRALSQPPVEIPVGPNPDSYFQTDGSLMKGDVLRTACQVIRVGQMRSHLLVVPLGRTGAPGAVDRQPADLNAVTEAAVEGRSGGSSTGKDGSSGSGSGPSTSAPSAPDGRRTVPLASVLKLLSDYVGAARALERAETRLLESFADAAARAAAAAAVVEAAAAVEPMPDRGPPELEAPMQRCSAFGGRCGNTFGGDLADAGCDGQRLSSLDASDAVRLVDGAPAAAAAAEAAAATAAATAAAEALLALRALLPLMQRGRESAAVLLEAAERCL